MNEKIKRKALLYVSFSLDFLERGTFTEYPQLFVLMSDWIEKQFLILTYLTTFSGVPAMYACRLLIAMFINLSRASRVAHAICGVM